MTTALREGYKHERHEQEIQNEARHILAKIRDARGMRHDAAVRWPFELLQNALDAGPREGRRQVEVSLSAVGGAFVFEHDGAFFRIRELAALLSGGSSKEFDGKDKTGRFGTGFLSTHVLGRRVGLTGLVVSDRRIEEFEVTLDRPDDQNAIIANIESCTSQIEAAQVIADPSGRPSARFLYPEDDELSLDEGLQAFHAAIPYLFGTCRQLGKITLTPRDGPSETWWAELVDESHWAALRVERDIRVIDGALGYRTIRMAVPSSQSAVIAVAVRQGSVDTLLPLPESMPRMFNRYPIRSTAGLAVNVVLDGRFELDETRRRIHFGGEATEATKETFRSALAAIVPLVEVANRERWTHRHLLNTVGRSGQVLSDDPTEVEWIDEELRLLAAKLGTMPSVETTAGDLPLIAGGSNYADIVEPRLGKAFESEELLPDRVWDLFAESEYLRPPRKDLAEDWSRVARAWIDLGVDGVTPLNLEDLAASVTTDAESIDDLGVTGDPRLWVARFADVVGEAWELRSVTTGILDGLLPNQNGTLSSAAQLHRDNGIPQVLKDVASAIGLDVRAELLDQQLADHVASPAFSYAKKAIDSVISLELSADEILERCIAHIRRTVSDDRAGDEQAAVLAGSIRLLEFLWQTRGMEAASQAREVPYLSAAGRWVDATSTSVMAPLSTWPEEAVPFADVYPPHRVLATAYSGIDPGLSNLVPHLIAWGIAYGGPLINRRVGGADFKIARLMKVVVGPPAELDDTVMEPTEMSDIALLHEILPRCQEEPSVARSLLGLVLASIAPADPCWSMTKAVRARRSNEQLELTIRPSIWLAELLSRTWVPVTTDEGPRAVTPDYHSIQPLLLAEWYRSEGAIRLLVEHFGFDPLRLQLEAVDDEGRRREIIETLARLVTVLGSEVGKYEALASHVETQARLERQRERFRRLGRAVQNAVEATLGELKLTVRVVDIGYDFEVADESLGTPSLRLALGPALMEVKATTATAVRMTPKQAQTSSARADVYYLCVVDLSDVPDERLDLPWSTSDILQRAKVTSGIGDQVRSTWQLVEEACEEAVPITGEAALRYAVSKEIWSAGVGLRDWMTARASELEARVLGVDAPTAVD